MADKLDVYTDVVTRLLSETVACTPKEWSKGTLFIASDGVRINYSLENPDEPGKGAISEKLRDLIDELYVRMSAGGNRWKQATFSFWQEGQDLKFKSSFTYDVQQQLRGDRPWWKLWS